MNRLWVRLSAAFLVVVWLAIAAIALIVQTTTERSFRTYLDRQNQASFSPDILQALQDYYTAQQTWAGADDLLPGPGAGGGGPGSSPGSGPGGAGRSGERRGATALLADTSGTVVVATDPALVGTALDAEARERATPLIVDGDTVGWLAQVTPGEQALGETEQQFLTETTRWLAAAAVGAGVIAVIVGGLLAWQLTRPLRRLTQGAYHLAQGKLGHQVPVTGAAEIADLAHAFNQMSGELAQGDALRRRMAADIAHELRTPVSVLRGHLEAMLDGVFPLDAEHVAVAHERTLHMARLVDDLRLLTLAEAGQLPLTRTRINAGDLARRAVESFTPLAADAGITLTADWRDALPPVEADVDRMQQVFGNLLTNALRHTPPQGTITVQVRQAGDRVRFAVINTGSGLTPDETARVFTPFWRAEDARERDRGGSGLGLSIARQLLRLHGGRIWAEAGTGAATFIFELPVHKET